MLRSLILLTLLLLYNDSQAQSMKEEISSVISSLFEGMYESDTSKMLPLFNSNAIMQTIISEGLDNNVKEGTVAQFLAGVAQSKEGELDEQFTIEAIQHDDNLAQVWVPYKFYYKGSFSHSGNNLFVLIRKDTGWKIQYIIDTRYRA